MAGRRAPPRPAPRARDGAASPSLSPSAPPPGPGLTRQSERRSPCRRPPSQGSRHGRGPWHATRHPPFPERAAPSGCRCRGRGTRRHSPNRRPTRAARQTPGASRPCALWPARRWAPACPRTGMAARRCPRARPDCPPGSARAGAPRTTRRRTTRRRSAPRAAEASPPPARRRRSPPSHRHAASPPAAPAPPRPPAPRPAVWLARERPPGAPRPRARPPSARTDHGAAARVVCSRPPAAAASKGPPSGWPPCTWECGRAAQPPATNSKNQSPPPPPQRQPRAQGARSAARRLRSSRSLTAGAIGQERGTQAPRAGASRAAAAPAGAARVRPELPRGTPGAVPRFGAVLGGGRFGRFPVPNYAVSRDAG